MHEVERPLLEKAILITGATGFIGSCHAARQLLQRNRVVAVSRSDRDGKRTRGAVRKALMALGDCSRATADALLASSLQVIDVDWKDLAGSLTPAVLRDIDEAWHVAAEMSYSLQKIGDAFEGNIIASCRLYELIEQHAIRCRRFFYVSTVYSMGMADEAVAEDLSFRPVFFNVYKATKWAAEQALANLARTRRLPLCIVRPGITVGSSKDGWYEGKPYGIYLFIDSMLRVKSEGGSEINLDLQPDGYQNFIPIDMLVDMFAAIGDSAHSLPEPVEVIHCVSPGQGITARDAANIFGDVVGLQVAFGPSKNRTEKVLNKMMAVDAPWTNVSLSFELSKIAGMVPRMTPHHEDPGFIRKLAEYRVRSAQAAAASAG